MFKSLPLGESTKSCCSHSADIASSDRYIVFRHSCGGKALFEALTYLFSIEGNDARQGRDRLFHGADNSACYAILDDLRN